MARLIAYISLLRQAIAENAPLCSLPLKSSSSRALHYSFFFLTLKNYLFVHAKRHVFYYFPDQGFNSLPLPWKHGISTTEPPGRPITIPFTKLVFRAFIQKDQKTIWQLIPSPTRSPCFRANEQMTTYQINGCGWLCRFLQKLTVFSLHGNASFSAWFRNLCLSLRPPDAKSQLIEKDPDAGKD